MKITKDRIVFVIINLILVAIVSSVSTYATSYLYNSNEVSYNNNSSGINADNVQSAIDELYEDATNYNSLSERITSLESNYNTLSTKVGTVSLDTTNKNLSSAVNEVYSSTVYSTSEKVVGKWIDGKPLYQKTLSTGALSTGDNIKSTGITNMDNLVQMFGSAYNTSYTQWITMAHIHVTAPASYAVNLTLINSASAPSLRITVGSGWNFSKSWVTLRYTKN